MRILESKKIIYINKAIPDSVVAFWKGMKRAKGELENQLS